MNIVEHLLAHNLTISFAESITGGLLASSLIDYPKASKVIKESYVVYSNEAKHRILGVKYDTIDKYDVVSLEVAQEMVIGLSKVTKAKICVATTGYASYDEENGRDTGIVCYAILYNGNIISEEVTINKSRNEVRNTLKDLIFNKIIEIIE